VIPTPSSFTIYAYTSQYAGIASSGDACGEISTSYPITLYSPSTSVADGIVLFRDDVYHTPMGGGNLYYKTGVGRSFSRLKISGEGRVSDVAAC